MAYVSYIVEIVCHIGVENGWGSVQGVCGIASGMCGKCAGNVWKVCGKCRENVRKCLESVWEVRGKCLEKGVGSAREVFGNC